MGRELTWKNIEAPDLASVGTLMNGAFNRFNNTITGIGDFFKQRTTEQDAEVQRAKDYYTNQAVTEFMLKARNSPDTVDQYLDGIAYGDDPTGYLLENFVAPAAQRASAMTGSVAPTAPLFDVNKLTTAIMAAEPTIRANQQAQDTYRQGELFKVDAPKLNPLLVKIQGMKEEGALQKLLETPLGLESRQANEQVRNAVLDRLKALPGERRAIAQDVRAANQEARQIKTAARQEEVYQRQLAAAEVEKQKALAKTNLAARFATNPFIGKTAEKSSMGMLQDIAKEINPSNYLMFGLDPTDSEELSTQLNKLDNLTIDFPVPDGKGGMFNKSIVVKLPDDLRRAVFAADAYNGSEGGVENSIDTFARLVSTLPTLSANERKNPVAALEKRGVDVGDRTDILQLANEALGYVAHQQELAQINATGVPPANPELATQVLLLGAASGDLAAQQIAAGRKPGPGNSVTSKMLENAKKQQTDPRLRALLGK